MGQVRLAAVENLWASSLMDSGHPGPVLESVLLNGRHGWRELSAKHARLVEIYGTPDPGLSLEQGLRRTMLARYHAMLAKAALRRELLKVNPNRQACGDQNADGESARFCGLLEAPAAATNLRRRPERAARRLEETEKWQSASCRCEPE